MLSKRILCLLLVVLISAMPVLFMLEANAVALDVTIILNNTTYNPGQNVIIRIYVQKLGVAVVGATVSGSISPPEGGVANFPTTPTGPPGYYGYVYTLPPSPCGGVWKISGHATKGADSGSAQKTFQVTGPPAKKSVNWEVFNPSISPPNPTSEDPVTNSVWLKIVSTVSPGPYPVDIICTVDGVMVDGGTLTISGPGALMVYTDPKKYPVGTHTVTWEVDPNFKYNDSDLGNNKVGFSFIVTAPAPAFDYSLIASPTSNTIKAGQDAVFAITATLTSGTAKSVDLSVDEAPAGATHTLSTMSGDPTFSSNLKVQTSETTPLGTHILTIKGEGGGVTKTITVALIVESAIEPDFEMSAVPPSQSITPPQSASFIITVAKKGDFKANVGLTISGVPAGIQPSFEPSSGEPDFTSTLKVTATQTVQPGTYAFTIYASGGGKTKSTIVNVVVREVPKPTTTTTTAPVVSPFAALEMLTEYSYLVILTILVLVIVALATALILRGRK